MTCNRRAPAECWRPFLYAWKKQNGGGRMNKADDTTALDAELDMLARRAGITIPPERRGAVLEAFADQKRMVHRLHQAEIPPEVESASCFHAGDIEPGAVR